MSKAFCSNAGLPGSFTKALSYDEQIQFLIDKYNKMADVINNLEIESKIDYVSYEPQRKTDLQKQQATENIGAVSTIANQILDEEEQMNARENINAMEYEAKDDFVKAGGAVVYDENFINILPNTNLATIAFCEPGRYYCADITGITGFSAAMPFEMEVFKINSNLVRRYFQYDNGRKYVQEVELNPLKFYAVVDFGGFNVSYLLQDLTEDQKAQARANIGAGTGSGSGSAENAVLYTAQELTEEQKTQARTNIYAKENKSDSDILFDGKGIDLTRPQTIVPNGADFNSAEYLKAGVYYGSNGNNITNYPINYRQPDFLMVVYNYTNIIIRYFYVLGEGGRTLYQEITPGENGSYNFGFWINVPGNAVLFTEQYLSESNKTNARNNIGAGTSNITTNDVDTEIANKAILYDTAQTLTDAQKTQARSNIGLGEQIETDIVNISDIYTINGTEQITINSIKSYKINNLVTCHIDLHVISGQSINVNTYLFKLNIAPSVTTLIPLYYYTSHSTPNYRYILCELDTNGYVENKLALSFGTTSGDGNIVLEFTYATT